MWPTTGPTNPVAKPSPESAAESKLIREVIANVTVSERDEFVYRETSPTRAHCHTIHGVARVREEYYWVPRLRKLAKKAIKSCCGCKRFQARALAVPLPGLLPKEKIEDSAPFKIVGVNFADPIRYQKSRLERKAYLVLYACSL